ncbi:helix-turn-helix domain-containing protein [Rhodovibrio sodomensis]|nr:helix-turn-helix transcriptional regulator [Rhodovibrio sodomensis]
MSEDGSTYTRSGVVAQRRRALKWTRATLASKAQVDLKTLRRMEEGTGRVQMRNVHKVATELGIPMAELLPAQTPAADGEGAKLEVRTRTAHELIELSLDANGSEVRPLCQTGDRETIQKMRQVHQLVARYVTGEGPSDTQDPFGRMEDEATLQELLDDLESSGFGVLAGVYLHWTFVPDHYEGADLSRYEDTKVLLLAFDHRSERSGPARQLLPYDPGDVPGPTDPIAGPGHEDDDDTVPF